MEPYPGWSGLTVSWKGRRFVLKTVADVVQMDQDRRVIEEIEQLRQQAQPSVSRTA